jgi:PAS domain S-box-containing protein
MPSAGPVAPGQAGAGPRRRVAPAAHEERAHAPRSVELPDRLLFEHNPQPTMVYERGSLRILAVSNAAVAAYGYTREELLGMTIKDLVPAEDVAEFERFLEARVSAELPGLVAAGRHRHRYKDGTVIDVETMSDDLEVDGRPARILLCQDVTERTRAMAELVTTREQLRRSEERYRGLFEKNPQPMVVYDRRTLEIVSCNDAMVAGYGYTADELRSMTVLDLQPSEDVESLREYLLGNPGGSRPELADARHGYPGRHRRRDGSIIEIEVTSENLDLDGRRCRVALYSDVTERKRAAEEVVVARDQALAASREKSGFVASVSHEIRTPMSGVMGMAELLLGTDLDDEQRDYAQQVLRSGEQMLAIINDLLDLSKIETGNLELEIADFDLRELLERACSSARLAAQAKDLAFAIEVDEAVPDRLRGDGRRLGQIALNLAANAVKFTAEGAVMVSVGSRPGADGATALRVEVADSGIGIDPVHLERIFDPFAQAEVATTRLYGGSGLGLAIARQLTELMGGRISAQSELGAGSTFVVEVELAPAAAAAVPRETDETAAASWAQPPQLLVVEDSQVNQLVAARALERCGCEVDVVSDGLEALEVLESRTYDAILMDCQMPGLDGYKTTAEIRRREEGVRHTPVIAMTAQAMDGDRERCLEAGMDDYLTKPLRHGELVGALQRWLPADG